MRRVTLIFAALLASMPAYTEPANQAWFEKLFAEHDKLHRHDSAEFQTYCRAAIQKFRPDSGPAGTTQRYYRETRILMAWPRHNDATRRRFYTTLVAAINVDDVHYRLGVLNCYLPRTLLSSEAPISQDPRSLRMAEIERDQDRGRGPHTVIRVGDDEDVAKFTEPMIQVLVSHYVEDLEKDGWF